MKTIFNLTMKSATRDPFLLLWSLIIPIGGCVLLGLFIKVPEYPIRIMTGMIASSVLFYAFITTAFAIMAQRRRGVYNLLRVTPMALWKYICSVSSAWTLIATFCGLIVMTVATVAFGLPLSVQSVLLVIPVLLMASIGFVFLSFFISSFVKTEGHLSMVTNVVMLPLFCSDAYYSLDGAPIWLQTMANFNPFQWFITALRSGLALNPNGYLLNIGLLCLVLFIALLLALRTFRYTDS